MSTASSAGARTPRDQYRDLRQENQLRAEQIRAHRLVQVERREHRRRQLTESLSTDWITPYLDLFDLFRRTGDPIAGGPTNVWQRKQGKNWPIYQTEQELNLLRAPARILLATNGYAQGLVEGLTSYMIGPGCTYRMGRVSDDDDTPRELIDAAQRITDEIQERNQWFGGEQPGIEEETFGRSIEDGEFILCHYPREDGWTDYRIREPEELTCPPGADVREYGYGVLTPRNDAQRVLRYYLQYGDSPTEGEEYETEEVTHFRRNVRRSMKRGVPDFTFDTYDALHLAGRLRTNLGDTAAQQAAIVYVRQHDNASQEDVEAFISGDADYTQTDLLTGNTEQIKRSKRGGREDIPKGMSYVNGPIASSTPIHIQVLDACLRGAGMRWQAPPWLMSGDLNAMNYATSLTAESPFVKTIQRRQRGYCEAYRRAVWFGFRHYVRTHGLRDRTGRVWQWEEIESRLKLTVTAPSPETRNKLEEANRAAIEIPLGVQSPQGYMQEQGRDPDRVEADNQEWKEKNGDPGQQLPLGGDGSAGARTDSGMPTLGESEHVSEGVYRWLLESERELLEAQGSGLVPKKITVHPAQGQPYERTVMVRSEIAGPPADRKPNEESRGQEKSAAPAQWPKHPASDHFQAAIGASGLPKDQQAEYAAAVASVLTRMPPFARDRLAQHVVDTAFFPDTKQLGLAVIERAYQKPNLTEEQRKKIDSQHAEIMAGQLQIGGAYLRHDRSLWLDGGMTAAPGHEMPGVHGGNSQTAAEIHAHELMHGVDGPNWQISQSIRWLECYEKEIGPKVQAADGTPRLTAYAQTNPQEALAEFGRLVYSGAVELDRVEREFPLAAKFFKEAKLWPS